MSDRHVPLALWAYMALARRGGFAVPNLPPRPTGPLVWMHMAEPGDAPAALGWFQRLRQSRPDATLALSGHTAAPEVDGQLGIGFLVPEDTVAAATAMLSHLRPAIVLWGGNILHPAVLSQAGQVGIPLILYHVKGGGVRVPKRVLGDPATAALPLFSDIYSEDSGSESMLRAQVPRDVAIHTAGRLRETMVPLPYSRQEHERLSNHLSGRPVWLAARVMPGELNAVLRAHRRASRYAHRLLLLLSPDTELSAVEIAAGLRETGLRARIWTGDTLPDETTQVVVMPDPEDLGLAYRVAPVCFLGRSLIPGHGGTNPQEAAILGSAILYGPHVGRYMADNATLLRLGAARLVSDTDTLATELTAVLAPDVAALMAQAAWEHISEGAELSDALLNHALDALDRSEAT